MLHYSSASSIEENRRYLVIKGGGACLVALARERGRQHHSRSGYRQQHQSRGLPEIRGGRNNEYNANINTTMRDVIKSGDRCALTWYEVVPVKGGNFPVFRVFGQRSRRGTVASSIG